jgi:hypothetical protein
MRRAMSILTCRGKLPFTVLAIDSASNYVEVRALNLWSKESHHGLQGVPENEDTMTKAK